MTDYDNKHSQQPDFLDNLFSTMRESESYLPDNGFTAGIMAQLPVRRGLAWWQKNLIILVSTVIGCALAATILPIGKLPIADLLSQLQSVTLGAAPLAIAGAVLLAMCGGIIWANAREII